MLIHVLSWYLLMHLEGWTFLSACTIHWRNEERNSRP